MSEGDYFSKYMPKELTDIESFKEIMKDAFECRVVKRGDKVKIKIRTKKLLYTYVTTEKESNELLKDTSVQVVEF